MRLTTATVTTLAGYALQAGLLALAFGIARASGAWAFALTTTNMQLLLAGGAALVLGSLVVLVVARGRAGAGRSAGFTLPLTVALVTGALCFLLAEVGIRVLARPDPLGARLGNTVLLPYDWPALAAMNRELLARSEGPDAFYVPDPALGWRIAPGRATRDGLAVSSAEGLRSATRGEILAQEAPGSPVALLGNSFAFSEEVTWQDSLAPKLQSSLGPSFRVLNFGVPGYGLDQAALRFRSLEAHWKPAVALLTFIEDDLNRVVNVYPFLKVDWGLPVSKPRYVLADDRLQLLNVPNLGGDELFGQASIFDLPLLDQDIEFAAERWHRSPFHASWVIRLLHGLTPLWPPAGEPVSPPVIARLGVLILADFVAAARERGAVPVIAYFPTRGDFQDAGARELKRRTLAEAAAAGIAVADLTPCLGDRLEPGALFVAGGHYTDAGNAAVAACLDPLVRAAAADRTSSP